MERKAASGSGGDHGQPDSDEEVEVVEEGEPTFRTFIDEAREEEEKQKEEEEGGGSSVKLMSSADLLDPPADEATEGGNKAAKAPSGVEPLPEFPDEEDTGPVVDADEVKDKSATVRRQISDRLSKLSAAGKKDLAPSLATRMSSPAGAKPNKAPTDLSSMDERELSTEIATRSGKAAAAADLAYKSAEEAIEQVRDLKKELSEGEVGDKLAVKLASKLPRWDKLVPTVMSTLALIIVCINLSITTSRMNDAIQHADSAATKAGEAATKANDAATKANDAARESKALRDQICPASGNAPGMDPNMAIQGLIWTEGNPIRVYWKPKPAPTLTTPEAPTPTGTPTSTTPGGHK